MKILIEIEGEVEERFKDYQRRENVKKNATAAYKLLADKLNDIAEKQDSTGAPLTNNQFQPA